MLQIDFLIQIFLGLILFQAFRLKYEKLLPTRPKAAEALVSIGIFVTVFLLYLTTDLHRVLNDVGWNHFNHYARALLDGHIQLLPPPNAIDISLYEGRAYVPFPMLPALIVLPFVAIWDVKFRIIFIGLIFGALNAVVVHRIARARKLNQGLALLFAAAFAFGTVHWWSSIRDGVWFIAHVVAVFFTLMGLHESVTKKRPWVMALMVGFAFMSRQMTVLSCFYYAFVLLQDESIDDRIRPRFTAVQLKKLAVFGGVMLLFVGQYMLLNWIRFDDPMNTGYYYIASCRAQNIEHGLFSLEYLGKNLRYFLWEFPSLKEGFPFLKFDGWGLSITAHSPFLFLLFLAPIKRWWPALVSILIIIFPILLYFNTGFYQFGFRFVQDVLPLMFLMLMAVRWKPWSYRTLQLLVVLSIVINMIGAHTM